MAAGAIQMGAGEAFICAGVESMTRVPMMGFNPMPQSRRSRESFPQAYISMGETAENVGAQVPDRRAQQQEDFAVRSQRKAAAAQQAGRLERRDRRRSRRRQRGRRRTAASAPDTTLGDAGRAEAGLPTQTAR